MVDTTIRIGLEIDGSQAIKEFENVTTASENVLANMKKIRSESDAMMPGTDSFFDQSELAVQSSFNRIDAINKQIDNTPVFSEHQLENLKAEREMLRRGIEATVKEMQQFASSSVDFVHSFSSKKGGTSSIQAITKMMPSLMNIVRQVADFQRESDTLMDAAAFKAGIKNKIVEAGLTNQLGFAKDSKSMDHLAEYLMLKGTDQTQRKGFMAHIANGYEKKQHLSDSFAGMLPEAFKAFHASKGTLAAPEDITQITAAERRKITEMLTNNPYFMQAAEASGVGRRMNGTIEIRSGITRGMVNRLAGNLYDTIITSAKGMPMYGITDVDDPQYWDRIARKSNKPFLGSMNSARVLSDNFDWLRPTIGAGYKDTGGSYTKVVDKNGKPFAVPFSPDIKRYEVANYTLEDLQKNIDLNRDRSVMYGQQTVKGINPYVSIDHSARLENIFRHRQNGVMPKNNDVVDDFLFLNLDDRLADPNLDEKTKQSLMDAYASYIDNGITKTVNGKSTHFSFTRAHKGLGLEFVQDAIFNAMAPVDPTTGERDLSAFWGGVKMPKVSINNKHLKDGKMVNYTPEEVFELGAKFVEYASKDATSGESIESLYGTILPDNLKIGIFDLEKATQKATEDQKIAGAGMNGTSYISKKLVPGGFQARMPGIKTALNSVDFTGFLSHFGGSIKTLGPDGRIEEITPDLDLLLSMSDIKNAGIRYQDDHGNLLPTAQIVDNIRQEIKNNGGKIFANKTMDDAQGGIHWMSRQFSQILGDDPEFVRMTTKAFLDEYQRVGTLEGALDTVFAGDSEMRDLILASHGAIMSDRKIQDRIQDFRTGMISRISQGDTILPRELETSRAMAQPWLFDAVIAGMKKINETGTGAAEAGKQTYYDAVFGKLSKEQQDTLSMITMDNNSVAYQKIMAEVLGIGRYPATSRSARTAENVLAGTSEKAKAMRAALQKSGFDPNAMYISPSSPLMTLLQDADFDGDVMDLIGLVYSGQEKNGPKLRAAEVFNEVYKRGIAKIDSMGLSQNEADARKERFTNAVFKMDSFNPLSGKDVMNIITPAKQGGYFMGGPDAVVRNAMQIPWTESVIKAIADAESQYSVNSVRNKKGLEMATTPEQMELLSKYRTFTEFFHAVNKNRDEFGNVDIPKLTEAMRGSDGLNGAKFWATNLPFHTMSSNVRTMMLSRYFAKQRGININEGYDWNYIFDSILGKKDEKTALGRMQSGLRDAWMGFLNADYLAIDEESIAKLAELRKLAVDEEAAKVATERHKEGSSSYGKRGSNKSIAERLVDRLGGNVIKNAAAGMVMSESHLQDAGINKDVFELLQAMHMPDVIGGIDLSKLLAMKTTSQTFEEMSATTKSTQLARTLDMFNLLTQTEKQNRIDNMPRLSFSTLAKLAYDPEEFMKDIVSGRENNSSLPATEIGQGAHTAIEHFMRARMSGAFRKDDGTVDEEGLKKAQQEALDVFDQYLGVQKAPKGFKWEGRGLTDAERADMLTPGSKLNERYERLKSFIGGNGLLSVFPEKDWEVIGIESSNVGSGEKTAKGNMKIPGKGKKILSPDKDVEMTGSYDLLFRNKKDGRVVMGDIKNYWDPTDREWEKWKVQQAIYASQLKKNGFDDIGSTIIEPYFNRQRNIGFTDYDFIKSDENVAKAIQAIQGLAKNGDTTIKDVYDVSKFIRETLFGDVRSSVGDQIADRYNKYTRSGKRSGGTSVSPGVISDALWMHDRYNEAIENDEDIHKFINKETRNKDSVYTSDMAWRSKYTQAEAIHEAAVIQEKSGRMAEAKDLDARYEAAIRDLDNNMGVALVNHITDFADSVRSSIDGQSGTKQIQDTVRAYVSTQNQQTGLEKSIGLFQDRIKETQGREEALAQSINQLTESDKNLAKDEDVYDRLIQYTKEALGLTEDTKNISSKSAAGKRAARTKLLNANAHIRDSSIFAAINQALNVGDRKSEESALTLMEQRKQELSNVRKDTQSEIQKKNAEKQVENLQGALMGDQLLKAQDLLNTTAPLTDIYLAQLKKSAMTSLDDSFIALAGVTDKNVSKPFTTSKARTDYINMVGNSLTDASSLLKHGIISEADFARYKAQVDTLMQEDNLSKVEQAAIDDAKRKLGMNAETPNEQREKWLRDRKQILEAERDLKKRDARRETIDAYKEARKNNQYARPIDYKAKIDEQSAKIDEQYEQDLARTEEERKYLESQNELARSQRLERLEYQNQSIREQRQRAYDQQLRARWGQPRSRSVAAYLQQENMRFGLLRDVRDNEFAAKQASERLTSYKDAFATKYGMSYDDYQKLSKEEKGGIAGDHIRDAQAIAETTQELTKYNDAANDAREQSKQFTPVMMGLSAGFQGASQTVGMLLSRFGRQAFYKIINESKQFVKQFDASMNEIQAITLKTSKAMEPVRADTISTAIKMRTSVTGVASTEAALYRQGLSDAEVKSRTESIIKFATVAKLKTEEATKIITTALQNNLVSSANEAMDSLVALGDKAATTAAEIGKGMQKAAASAKVANVSYAELTSLLTIGTADTQLSGTQVGTALQTIFSRMRRLSLSKVASDQNGSSTTASDAEAALKAVGVDLYDNKTQGKMRSAFAVLSDLSKVWQSLSDTQKSIATNALAGTRMTNVFSTLMEGMSEDNGATLEKYLGLAENSEGITQTKYEIAMQSLSASLNELKSSWDGLVESFVSTGTITNVLDSFSDFLQFASKSDAIGQGFAVISGAIVGIGAAIAAASMAVKTASPALMVLSGLIGLVAGVGTGAIALTGSALINSLVHPETEEEKAKRLREEAAERIKNAQQARVDNLNRKEDAIEKVEKYGEAFDKLKNSEDELAKSDATRNLMNSLRELSGAFPDLDKPIEDSISNLENWAEAIKAAKLQIDDLKNANNVDAVSEGTSYIINHGNGLYKEYYDNRMADMGSLTKDQIEQILQPFGGTAYASLQEGKLPKVGLEVPEGLDTDAGKLAFARNILTWNNTPESLKTFASFISLINSTLGSQIMHAGNDFNALYSIAWNEENSGSLTKAASELIDQIINPGSKITKSELQNIGIDFIEDSLLEQMPTFENIATDKFSAEYLKKAFLNGLEKEILNPKDYKILDNDGRPNWEEISRYYESMFRGRDTDINERVTSQLTKSDYAYHIDDENAPGGFVGFTSYEEATDYVSKNGKYSFTEIKDSSDRAAYRTAKEAASAATLSGSSSDKTKPTLHKAIGRIRKANSFEELYQQYDKEGMGPEFGNALVSSPELLGAYIMASKGQMSYEQFQKAAETFDTGRQGSRVGFIETIMNAIKDGSLSVEEFRTSADFSGVYASFKDLVGDAADEVLNAIEDGVDNPEAMKQFNKAIVQQRIKEAMQFNKYYDNALAYATTALTGTETERLSSNAAIQTETQSYYDYLAAVQRYANGTAKSGDYATIAAYDKSFTETQLRNGVSGSQLLANAGAYKRDIVSERQADFDALLAGVGISSYGDLDKKITDEQARRYAETFYGDNPQVAEYVYASVKSSGLTQREYANAMNSSFNSSMSYWNNNSMFAVDEEGRVSLKNKPEEKLSAKAIRDAYKQSVEESDLSNVYRDISNGIFRGETIAKKHGEDLYSKLIESTDYGMLLGANVSPDEIRSWAKAQAEGRELLATEGWQKGWSDLFGGQNITAENILSARSKITASEGSERAYYEAFLNAIPSEMKDLVLNGEPLDTETAQDVFDSYNEWLAQQTSLKGLRNAAEIAANQTILKTGNAAEKLALQSQFGSTMSEAQQAQYILSRGDISQASTLASYLGMTEEQVRTAMSTGRTADLTNALDVLQREQLNKIAGSYGYTGDVTKGAMEDNVAALRAYAKANGKTDLENLLNAYDENGNLIGVDSTIMRKDFGKQYTRAESARLARQAYTSGLTYNQAQDRYRAEDWAAIENFSPELAQYMKMSASQKASLEGQNLKRTIETQFIVTGIQDLENAGKVAEGTAEAVEKLAKGGKTAIDMSNQVSKEAFTSGQQRAKLYNGSAQEKAQAAMAYLGLNEEEYYANEEANYQRALATEQASRAEEGAKYAQLYDAAIQLGNAEEAQRQLDNARSAGFEITAAQKQLPEGWQIKTDKNGVEHVYNKWGRRLTNEDVNQYRSAAEYTGEPGISRAGLKVNERQFTKAEANALSRRLMRSGKGWNEAIDSGMFTDEEIKAISNNNPDVKSYLAMSKEQQASVEGQNLKRRIDVQIAISGVDDLEEAGELLEGTSKIVENLKKGGKFEIEAIVKMNNDVYEKGQQRAKLFNGTEAEQDEIAKMLLQMSDEQYYAGSVADVQARRELAKQVMASDTTAFLNTQNKLYNQLTRKEDKDRFRKTMEEAGYEYGQIGYMAPEGMILDEKDGVVYNADGTVNGTETTKYRNNSRYGFKEGEAAQARHANAFLSKQHQFTESELLAGRRALFGGTLTENSNPDLYQAVTSSLGVYGQEYMLQKTQEGKASDRIEMLARYESEQTARDQARQYATEIASAERASNAISGANTAANRSAIASFLDYDEDQVKQLMESESGKKSLQEEIQQKTQNFINKFAEELEGQLEGVSLDTSSTSNFISSLQEAKQKANEAMAEVLQEYIDALSAISESVGAPSDFSTAFDKAMDQLKESKDAEKGLEWLMSNAAGITIPSGGYRVGLTEAIANDANASGLNWSWLANNTGIAAGINLVDRGTWSPEQLADYAKTAFYNGAKTPEYYTGILKPLLSTEYNGQQYNFMDESGHLNIDTSDAQQVEAFINLVNGLNKDETASAVLHEVAEEYGDISQIASELSENADNASKHIRSFNENVNEKKANDVTKYSKAIDKNLKQALGMFANGGQDTRTGLALWKKGMKDIANQAAAVQKAFGGMSGEDMKKARSKKNDQTSTLLSQLTGIDVETIEEMSNSEIQDLLGDSVETLNERMSEAIEGLMEASPVEIDMSSVKTSASGEIDLTDLEAAYAAAGDVATAQALALAGHYADIFFKVTQNGEHISVDAVVNASKGSTGKKGGGGGGGKSKVDKLLEEQKHEIGQVTHKLKMEEEREKQLEFNYDFTGQRESYKEQISIQGELINTYEKHISALEKMLTKTKEGTNDWWKLKEAIDAAKESIESAKNAINDLKINNVESFVKEYEQKERPHSHGQSMRDKFASLALTEDRYQDYILETEASIKDIQNRRKTKEKLINDLKKKLGTLTKEAKNTGEREKIKEEIEQAQEDLTDLEVEEAEKLKDIQQQKLSHVAQVLSQNTQTATHNNSVAEMYGSAFEASGYRAEYNQMIKEQISASKDLIKYNETAKAESLDIMRQLEKQGKAGSTEWFEAQDAVYQYDEAIAQATTSQMEFNRALQESKIEAVAEKYTDATREIVHVQDLLSGFAAEALERKDYDAYFSATDRFIETVPLQVAEAQKKLKSLNDQYTQGMSEGILDPTTQRKLLDEINAAEKEIDEIERTERSKKREYAQQKISQISENQGWNQANYEHNQKILSLRSSTYQSLGELTNYGLMLETDNNLRNERVEALQRDRQELENALSYVEAGSEEERKILEMIRQKDEALASENSQLEKNNKLLEENEKKILQVRKALEDSIDKEVEAQKKRDREMLAGNVSMQNSILDVIRKRMQAEWDLKKKDIEKEKESLNEYKKLINERFNYRKKASQQQDKDEELAEYRKQLALVEADLSRSKEAKELRRKIEELEKEQSWTVAEDELNAENERIDEQVEGMDRFVQYNEELLNEILGDANNFATELNNILSGSFEESYAKIIEYMRKENEAFMNSLPAAQQQMIQSWEDTWKKANDIIDSNYETIKQVLNIYDEFGNLKTYEELSSGSYRNDYIEWMKNNDRQYRLYSDVGDNLNMELLIKDWDKKYTDFLNSIKSDASFEEDSYDLRDVVSDIESLSKDVYNINNKPIDTNLGTTLPDLFNNSQLTKDFSEYKIRTLEDLDKIYAAIVEKKEEKKSEPEKSSGKKSGSGKKTTYYIYSVKGAYLGEIEATSEAQAIAQADKKWGPGTSAYKEKIPDRGSSSITKTAAAATSAAASAAVSTAVAETVTSTIFNQVLSMLNIPKNAEGGLVDYTGLAWVDGTKTRPESFLDATDTKLLRSLLDTFDYVSVKTWTPPTSEMFADNSTNVGDINITINQAELKSDDDYSKVARRVGQEFSKELRRNGINLSGYSFA